MYMYMYMCTKELGIYMYIYLREHHVPKVPIKKETLAKYSVHVEYRGEGNIYSSKLKLRRRNDSVNIED